MSEGNSYVKLLQMMKNEGYNKNTNIIIGKVISSSPLEIDMGEYTIKEDDFFIAERLTRHSRIVTLNHQENAVRELGDGTEKDKVTSSKYPSDYTDDMVSPYTSFSYQYLELKFEDILKVGDKVIVLIDNSDFYIIDRVVG